MAACEESGCFAAHCWMLFVIDCWDLIGRGFKRPCSGMVLGRWKGIKTLERYTGVAKTEEVALYTSRSSTVFTEAGIIECGLSMLTC